MSKATKATKVYCIECGAGTELECICDELNFAQEQECTCGEHNKI